MITKTKQLKTAPNFFTRYTSELNSVMARTPVYTKLRIISLSSQLQSINSIVRQLHEENIKIRRQTVARILKKFKREGTLTDETVPGRKTILTREQLEFIDAKMEENDELTSIGETRRLFEETYR